MTGRFEGVTGALAAWVMAKVNREAEAEAVALLDPSPAAAVLVIGFGPGVGVRLLAERLAEGRVVGVDPSSAMLRAAGRANRAGIAAGRVALHTARADALPTADAAFDGAITVNTLQLCEPFSATVAELARVLKPGARLVGLTHDWALRRHAGTVEAWLTMAKATLQGAGFVDIRDFRGTAEQGRIVALIARCQARCGQAERLDR